MENDVTATPSTMDPRTTWFVESLRILFPLIVRFGVDVAPCADDDDFDLWLDGAWSAFTDCHNCGGDITTPRKWIAHACQGETKPVADDELKRIVRGCLTMFVDGNDVKNCGEDRLCFRCMAIVSEIRALLLRTQHPRDPMMVAHFEGAETTLHPVDKPCAKCRPPIEINDDMVKRGVAAIVGRFSAQYNDKQQNDFMYDALDAALNGEAKR